MVGARVAPAILSPIEGTLPWGTASGALVPFDVPNTGIGPSHTHKHFNKWIALRAYFRGRSGTSRAHDVHLFMRLMRVTIVALLDSFKGLLVICDSRKFNTFLKNAST